MKSVLAIDPDSDFLKWVDQAPERADVRVLTATDAEQGLAMFQQEKPDLVLLDLHLQPVTGMELLRRLRQPIRTRWWCSIRGFPPPTR